MNEAREILLNEQKKTFADPKHKLRLNKKLADIDRMIFFSKLDSLLDKQAWPQALQSAAASLAHLRDSPDSVYRVYAFDLYQRKSVIFKRLNETDSMIANLEKALQYPTERISVQRQSYEQLGLFYASEKSYIDAREMFDKSVRRCRIDKLSGKLKEVYALYMNGKFRESLDILEQIPDKEKDEHWKNLEIFLAQNINELNLENRFQLW